MGEPSRFLREMPEEQLLPLNAGAGRVQEPAAPALAVPRYEPEETAWPIKVGARVRHARFGEGLVVGVERDGADMIVTVGFASVGRKRLSLQYAHLEETVGRDQSREDVEHVARLSRLALGEAELERMREQLDGILAYIDTLRALDTARRRADLPRGAARQRDARGRGAPVPVPGRLPSPTRPTGSAAFFRVPRIIED